LINKPLKLLSDIASTTHARIQTDFPNIDPVIGVNQGMRNNGYPADILTIDCLKTNKRIIILLHDDTPEMARYQFAFRNKDPDGDFKDIQLADITIQILYDWVSTYFTAAS
jgi:hypothetical protein